MSEDQQKDHWEQLASELGAEPPSTEAEGNSGPHDEGPRPPEEQAQTEPAAELYRPPGPPKKKPPPTDWGAIASALGVIVAPEPEQPPTPVGRGLDIPDEVSGTAEFIEEAREEFEAGEEEDVVETPDVTREGPREDAAERSSVPFAPELQPGGGETREEVLPLGDMPGEKEPSGRAQVDAAQSARAEGEASFDAAEKGPSRRRRRRRRKPKPGEKDAPEASEEEAGDEEKETRVSDEEAEAVDTSEVEKDEDRDRGKRRRKRRPGKRKKKAEVEADAVAASASPEAGATQAAPGEADTSVKSQGDEAARPSRKAERQKPSHRAIPTWGEAIGLIISGNLERRKKSGGISRGRGRGRKGRASSEGKSSSGR